jgi:putative resolvase
MRPHEFAQKLGVTVKTLQRWDQSGKLPAKRTPSGHRYYNEEDAAIALGLKPTPRQRKTIVYCRVSSNPQKPELDNQLKAMEQFCLGRGVAVDEWITEIGGGLNFKRKKFLKMLLEGVNGEIEMIVVAHRDRLCRFAFDLIESLLREKNCQILVANQISLSPQQELVEDLLAIIHCFSYRLYGSRNYTKQVTQTINQELENKKKIKLDELQC